MRCYYIYDDKPGDKPVYQGFAWLKLRSNKSGGLIAVHGLRNLEHYAQRKGLNGFKELKRSPHSTVIDSVSYDLVLPSKIPHNGRNRPLLALHPSADYLDKLYAITQLSQMLVVVFSEKDISTWKKYSSATEYGKEQVPVQNNLNKVVQVALKHLNMTLNMANGMNHPRNQDFFKSTFAMLLKHDEKYDSEDVKAWLISNAQWDPKDAQQAASIVEDIKKAKRIRLSMQDHRYKEDTIEKWRKEAETI